jgi:SecD/SecF fusion protein
VVLFVALVGLLVPARLYLRPFFWRIAFCLIPIAVALVVVGDATHRYVTLGGGFKLGVDLVGGTILVYEVDPDKMDEKKLQDFKPEQLAARLKSRIDPNDLYNVTIRPVNTANARNARVEIILPTGGSHQAEIQKREWENLLQQVRRQWPALNDAPLESLGRGNRADLIELIQKDAKVTSQDAEQFISEHYAFGADRKNKDVTAEYVQHVKNLIAQVGALEFRILANDRDDKAAVEAAQKVVADAANKEDLQRRAIKGMPPPPPRTDQGADTFQVVDEGGKPKGQFSYSWVELGPKERWTLNLNNDAENPWDNAITHLEFNWPQLKDLRLRERVPAGNTQQLLEEVSRHIPVSALGDAERIINDTGSRGANWKLAAEARKNGTAVVLSMPHSEGTSTALLYSRPCQDVKLPEKERKEKKYEYFLLTRDPERVQVAGQDKPEVKEVTGSYLTAAKPSHDEKGNWEVAFGFNSAGGNLFYELTSSNSPTGPKGTQFFRHLAIVLDGQIVTAPSLHSAIRSEGRIMGSFTEQEVNDLVNILRAGALPATLKPQPVSENTMGATLGSDTIRAGTISVGLAFLAVLAFMIAYYRFAGLVASSALLANLLLTVAFMVLVSATFTLPGLAGLVLMLGMAVDANVLIYERVREERDRGASLPLAIRNGYDRAFPTIIDTHLSSIFTAVVLYAVGNDQLKGFGISLTVGLIISLFTSLYMTRLLFDLCLARGWLHKLSMFRLFSRPNIDFMGWRRLWFTATVALTVFGIAVFVGRLPEGLNIDFNGGTAYGGQTVQKMDIRDLRRLLDEDNQRSRLRVGDVRELSEGGEEGYAYAIPYLNEDGTQTVRTIQLPNRPEGATREAREADVKNRAGQLPDVSVELIFPKTVRPEDEQRGFFTVRTSEKAPELVQAAISRLLGDALRKTELVTEKDPGGKKAVLSFRDPADPGRAESASPALVDTLLRRACRDQDVSAAPSITPKGDEDLNGRFPRMEVVWSESALDAAKLDRVLDEMKKEFQERPLPDRLESFDAQLAQETQTRAMYAILGSWGAILLYLWFRFGNWTFGLAAVICLIHDLFFTLGIIAFCHYIHQWSPGLASVLAIQDFKIDLAAVAALLTLVGYSVNDTIVVFDRIREVRGKNPELTHQMINDSVNQTLSRTLLTAFTVFLVVFVLYVWGGEGVHLFAFVMLVGVLVGTYSSIYIASPLLLIFGEGRRPAPVRGGRPLQPAGVSA